jgi:transglutaminase-like putative cysteine protease
MFRKYSRIIAAIVVCFFTWTSGGVFSIAHAAQQEAKKGKAKAAQQKKTESPEERFSKITEELEGALADTKTDIASKKARLTAGRDEINKLDSEMRAQFAVTEQKLKDAKLPAEILERHHKFVKHYDDNLNELKGNVERVEKAKNQAEIEVEVEKTRKHLERVKAPSRHQKLDPNNLPHRQPKTVKREPRMKKEEFDQDLKKDKHAWKDQKRIQVASTGSLAGMLVSNSFNAIAQPTAADLAETIDVQLTPEIRAKALELGNNPVKIYEWVRNNIEFVPTWGSIQGAQMTMLTKQGNAFDTASLLIALLRAAGIQAHYVTGTITLPIDKVMNWAGGFTNSQAALNYIASGGVPIKGGMSGGNITKVQMEHMWVEAYVPYENYRGTMRDQSVPTWIPLDASFKQYNILSGFDLTVQVPFSQDNYLAGVNSQNSLHYYQSQIQTYLDTTLPDKSIVDAKGRKEIAEEKFKLLPSSLPYKTIVVASKTNDIGAESRAKVTFRISSSDELSDATYSASAPELTGKRVTLSYRPATTGDEALVASYGGFMFNVPAYMLLVKPELRLEGNVVLTGEATTLGNEQSFTMEFNNPGGAGELTQKKLVAGGYYALGLDLAGINEGSLGKRNGTLRDNLATLPPEAYSNDGLIGEHLNLLAKTYFLANDKLYSSGAKLYNVAQMRSLSGGFVSIIPSVSYIYSIPQKVTPAGMEMDIRMERITVVARDGNPQAEKSFMEMAGLVSSFNEHYIFEAIDGFSSVSAVKVLQTANQNGIAVYKIDAANIEQIVPLLQVRQEVVADIRNSVNAGKDITIPQKNIQINDWNGLGYIVRDPVSGSGAYIISGGLAGGGTATKSDGYQIVEIFKGAYGWIKDRLDPQTRNTIVTTATLEVGEEIVETAEDKKNLGVSYEDIGRCTGLVIKSYESAGIYLRKIAKEKNFGYPENASNMYLMIKNTPDFSVGAEGPIVGDIIFFHDTNPNRNPALKQLGDDGASHVGIVQEVQDGKVTSMIHAAGSKRGIVIQPLPNGIEGNNYYRDHFLLYGRPR